MDPAAGGQNLSQVLTDFHKTQSGDGKTLPQCSGKASSDGGGVQVKLMLTHSVALYWAEYRAEVVNDKITILYLMQQRANLGFPAQLHK